MSIILSRLVYSKTFFIADLFTEKTRKRKADDNSVRGFKKMRLDKKLKKKFHKNQDTTGKKVQHQQNRDGRNRKFQDQQDGRKKPFNRNQDGDKRNNQRGDRPFNKQRGDKPFNKQKKVFGGKFNKNKMGNSREGRNKGKGKGRK